MSLTLIAFIAAGILSYAFVILVSVLLLRLSASRHPQKAAQKALLVIAHPDDEAMFFSPTLTSSYFSSIHILCLSTGDAGGLGKVRAEELLASAVSLGVPKSNVRVVDHPGFRDGLEEIWDVKAASRCVSLMLNTVRPDVVLAFDAKGVTGHPNHVSSSQAVVDGVKGMSPGATPAIYTLDTISTAEKFFLPLYALELFFQRKVEESLGLVLCSPGAWPWWWCNGAMVCHLSQYVWHRVLWVTFSSYAVVNFLRLKRVGSSS